MKRKPLDALSALVMMQQAAPDDLVQLSFKQAGYRSIRWYCAKHAEEVQHRIQHRDDVVKYPPEIVCRMIARDYLVDFVRTGKYRLYGVERRSEQNWSNCRHCVSESRVHERV